ncbi:MAG: hypothetical protein WEF28_06895 [Acidimicrobiia bacterium]
MPEIEVWVSIADEDVFAGTLYSHFRRAVESATFRYAMVDDDAVEAILDTWRRNGLENDRPGARRIAEALSFSKNRTLRPKSSRTRPDTTKPALLAV